jgi:hypothetical protein
MGRIKPIRKPGWKPRRNPDKGFVVPKDLGRTGEFLGSVFVPVAVRAGMVAYSNRPRG